MDALAALVPAEILAAHGLLVGYTVGKVEGKDPHDPSIASSGTRIEKVGDAQVVFFALLALSVIMYVGPRWLAKTWDWTYDWVRMLIPAVAFVAWTMLQQVSAFDAVFPKMDSSLRVILAVIGAIALGLVVAALGTKAQEQKVP